MNINLLHNIYQKFNFKLSSPLIADELALLTPRKFHELKWNRFINTHEKKGRCIQRDLRNEHLNFIAKQNIKSVGYSNISDANVMRMSKTVKIMETIVKCMRSDFEVANRDGKHRNTHAEQQFKVTFAPISIFGNHQKK